MNDVRSYRGDPNLKRAGSPIEWTQDLIEEFIKCKNDVIYFSEKYVKIVTEDGLVPITLRDYQKELILSMVENRATYSLQCRQSGKCCTGDTRIKLKNKTTGEIMELTMEDFYEMVRSQ